MHGKHNHRSQLQEIILIEVNLKPQKAKVVSLKTGMARDMESELKMSYLTHYVTHSKLNFKKYFFATWQLSIKYSKNRQKSKQINYFLF